MAPAPLLAGPSDPLLVATVAADHRRRPSARGLPPVAWCHTATSPSTPPTTSPSVLRRWGWRWGCASCARCANQRASSLQGTRRHLPIPKTLEILITAFVLCSTCSGHAMVSTPAAATSRGRVPPAVLDGVDEVGAAQRFAASREADEVKGRANYFYYVKTSMDALQNKVSGLDSIMEGFRVDDKEWENVFMDRDSSVTAITPP